MPSTFLIRRAAVCAAASALLSLTGLSAAFASVHAGDQLQVTVYNHPELSERVTVNASDALSLPLAGTVNVSGLETTQIAVRIQHALEPYVKYPAVDVQLTGQTASLFVSGGPGGVLRYEPGETLAAALADLPSLESANAADATPAKASRLVSLERSRIDLHRVGLTRNGRSLGTFDAVALSARGEGGPQLLPADTINLVNKPKTVRVLGDVQTPGAAYLWNDEPLADALQQVGGPTDSAASSNLQLDRDGTKYALALGDARFHEPAQSGDVITVPTAPRVSVVGLVDHPGPVTLKTDFTLLNALYQAGGPTKWADLSKVAIVHDGIQSQYNLGRLAHGDTTQNPALQDGDLVFVPEGHKVDFLPIFQALLPILYLFPRP